MMRTTNEIELLGPDPRCVSLRVAKTVEPEPVSFDDAPVMEPEAGPAPVTMLRSQTWMRRRLMRALWWSSMLPLMRAQWLRTPGLWMRVDLVEPLLADEALKARFEAAFKQALDDPQAAEAEFDAIAAAAPDFYFAPYNAALCRLRAVTKRAD